MPPFALVIDEDSVAQTLTATLTGPDGQTTAATVELARFTGDWSLDKVQDALNDRQDRQRAQSLGRGLFDRLFDAASALRAHWDAAVQANPKSPLEVRINSTALAGYPWELLWDDKDRKHARVGGLIRRWPGASAASPSSDWPFRLLLIVGADDAKLDPADRIDALREVALVRKALVHFGRTLDIQLLLLPSHEVLRTVLHEYQPHVLHFVGHGTFDLGKKRHAVVIEHAAGTWNWNTSEIKEDLTVAGCIPRLAFLNCCRSGAERQSSLGLQRALSELGVPVVVAMQADVRGDYAATFSETFYAHALGVLKPNDAVPSVAEAVREGRRKLGAEDDVDWGLPTLTCCADVPVDHALIARRVWPNDPAFRTCREFDDARVFAFDEVRMSSIDPGKPAVDVLGARRKLIYWCHPVKQGKQPSLIIVRGPAGSGRTRLLHWCMETWALADPRPRLRYVRVDRPRGKNTVQWLVRLRAGEVSPDRPEADRFLKDRLPLDPFAAFYEAVAKAAQLLQGPTAVDDPARRIELIDTFQREVTDDVPVAPICQAFLAGLQQIGEPLVVVFDQLSTEAISPKLFAGFRDAFLAAVASQATNVRVALALSREDHEQFELAGLDSQSVRIVDVEANHTTEELTEKAVEALRYTEAETLREIAKLMLKLPEARRSGLGRLEFCQPFLERPGFRDLERMR